ncbi:uncharacterized protein LOC110731601 isoform X1 [Chenopodium quinoa]|uniref:uncharacterized protein LOC110731601 isoform X1 n=1 Tax=Chenopodium quinoa TaxID=63459 RepID=UPI000B799C39|nr:uncharacterized protein LOC110731601 isoform X1 [Chenopodium quinoa]
MCDCVQSAAIIANRFSSTRIRILGQSQCGWNSKPVFLASEVLTGYKDCSVMNKLSNRKCRRIFRHEVVIMDRRVVTNLGVFGSNAFDSSSDLRLKEEGDEDFVLGLRNGEEKLQDLKLGLIGENEAIDNTRNYDDMSSEKNQNGELGHLSFDELLQEEGEGIVSKAEDLMSFKGDGKNEDLELGDDQVEELQQSKSKPKNKLERKVKFRSRKQLAKRSSILAKQVIGIESACSLGFVSQLWVDTATWAVMEVEVRPNLLSSDSVKFLLEDIKKVGDVVLVQEDNFIQNEFRTVGLETLVGYSVVTPGQRNLGKVRGYTFNINSGSVESLELDAFGYSVIPSSLVSTYALFSDDVLEVVSDLIIVHEAAASRIQRLTKGLLGTKIGETSSINLKNRDMELDSTQSDKYRKPRRKPSKRKFYPGTRDLDNDFDLPMDYM